MPHKRRSCDDEGKTTLKIDKKFGSGSYSTGSLASMNTKKGWHYEQRTDVVA